RSRIIISTISELRKLDKAQGGQRPLIDIELARKRSCKIRKRPLLKGKANARCTPKFGKKFLSVLLQQFDCRFLGNQILLREGNEQRTTGFLLLSTRGRDSVRIDMPQSDRRFGTIQFRIARSREQDLSILSQKFDRLFVPKKSKRAGESLSGDDLQGAVDRKEARVAAEISATGRGGVR